MILRVVYSVVFFLLPMIAFCQPLPPPNPVPLDGGLGLLIAGGSYYAYKKIKASSKKDV